MKKIVVSALTAAALMALGTVPSSADGCCGGWPIVYGYGVIIKNTPYYRWSRHRIVEDGWGQKVLGHGYTEVGPIGRAVYPTAASQAGIGLLIGGAPYGVTVTTVDE
jgi:hypothetical protein